LPTGAVNSNTGPPSLSLNLRSQYSRWIQSACLAIAGLAICCGFWIAANRYWTFTHDQQLRMMQTAARDKADAIPLTNADKEFAEAMGETVFSGNRQ
jgi:hypothetical protein